MVMMAFILSAIFQLAADTKKKTEENNCSEYDKMLKYLLE